MNDVPKPRVAFIGGIGRSGSTLLELLLASSTEIEAIGESVHLWERGLLDDDLCGCGQRFSRCPFWTDIGTDAFGGWTHVDVRALLRLKDQVDRTRFVPLTLSRFSGENRTAATLRYGSYYADVYSAVVNRSGATVVLDSSKHVSLAAVLAMTDRFDLRIVQMVRQPEAVAYSWGRSVPRPEAGGDSLMATASAQRIAARWSLQNGLFALIGREVPLKIVKYEDLIADPNREARKVRQFLGLSSGENVVGAEGLINRPTVHSVAGNPMRFADGPVRVRPDDAWRRGLSPRDKLVVRALTAPLVFNYKRQRPIGEHA